MYDTFTKKNFKSEGYKEDMYQQSATAVWLTPIGGSPRLMKNRELSRNELKHIHIYLFASIEEMSRSTGEQN